MLERLTFINKKSNLHRRMYIHKRSTKFNFKKDVKTSLQHATDLKKIRFFPLTFY